MSENESLHLKGESATLAYGMDLARATFCEPDARNSDSDAQFADEPGRPTVGGIIYLQGDLGAGKTTLTRGVLRGFGYQGPVKSPTYTLVEPYEFKTSRVYHFDLYRLSNPEEVSFLGIEEYFNAGNLCLIEWPDRGLDFIPAADIILSLTGTGTAREIVCQSQTEKGADIAQRLCSSRRN